MLVYGECECFVMQMLYVCVLCAFCGSSQCCVLHNLQFVHAGQGCNRRPYKPQHSTVTALHTLNNTVAKGFNQMAPPARTITVALDMSKAFDTINTHTLIRKMLQTNIPGTIIKFIANNINIKLAFHKVVSLHSIQHLHVRLTTTQCTGSGHGLCRRHHNHIHTHKYECSPEIHTTIHT